MQNKNKLNVQIITSKNHFFPHCLVSAHKKLVIKLKISLFARYKFDIPVYIFVYIK